MSVASVSCWFGINAATFAFGRRMSAVSGRLDTVRTFYRRSPGLGSQAATADGLRKARSKLSLRQFAVAGRQVIPGAQAATRRVAIHPECASPSAKTDPEWTRRRVKTAMLAWPALKPA